MSDYYFMINGIDILPYVESDGIKITIEDLDGPNAGRGLNGLMIRDRVASKMKWEIKCKPLYSDDAQIILRLIMPQFVTVSTNIDPLYGERSTIFYSNNRPATAAMIYDSDVLWTGIEFPLIER